MFDRLDDTIVAVSSPPGAGGRGIIRLSGPTAAPIAHTVFTSDSGPSLLEVPGHRRLWGRVRIDERSSVPAEAYVFRAPASYTRQNIVELHTVGSPAVLAMIVDALVAAGARPAEAGEFTARAFFHGALDLTEVEGVAAMIAAANDSQLRASEALLHGRLSRRSIELRDQLADLLALLEADIDFVEEPIEFVTAGQVREALGRIVAALDALLSAAPDLERLEALPRVLLVGRPNAGKSTLFNRLTGLERAIPSAQAGTTRDVISAPLSVPGGEASLLDCAGVDSPLDAGEPSAADPDALARRAALRALGAADLVLLVVDATADPNGALESFRDLRVGRATITVLNKIDALTAPIPDFFSRRDVAEVSARTGAGLDALRGRIGQALFGAAAPSGQELPALSHRQRAGLDEARAAAARALEMCENARELKGFVELLAVEVRAAMNALSLLSGQIATEELLARIFARFCIGK
ncbi:MAG: 50S ribosome-binding GTPase [Phycisphaerae bacterium]|jgi:tRNA modification GTPase